MYVIGLYGSVIQCKRMLEGELSIRMSDFFFVPYTIWKKRGGGEIDKHWVELEVPSVQWT